MALIECSECGNKVSDKAEYCPNCGCPIEGMINDGPSNEDYVWEDEHESGQYDYYQPKKLRRWLWSTLALFILSAVAVGAWLFASDKLLGHDTVEITPEFIAAVHQYDELYPFSEGLAAVKKNGKFGYINTKGELVIPCQFRYASGFVDRTALVAIDKGKPYCILDRNGKITTTKYIFNSENSNSDAECYSEPYWNKEDIRRYEGIYSLSTSNGNGKCVDVFINEDLQEVNESKNVSPRVLPHDNKYTVFSRSSKDIYGDDVEMKGLKDKDGNVVIPAEYNYLEPGDNGVVVVSIFVEDAESHHGNNTPEGRDFYAYFDLNGYSTFTAADLKRIEAYKKAQLAKNEELERQAAEEQARLEEERRQEELRLHPENQFNELTANTAWVCYGYNACSGRSAEFVVSFRSITEISGYASVVKWDGYNEHSSYYTQPSHDDYYYTIRGDVIELTHSSPRYEMSFKIVYQNGDIVLQSYDWVRNGVFRPVEKSSSLFPSSFNIY